ncbi:hypothetical protein Tco_0336448 [Tanacetum coccineum]
MALRKNNPRDTWFHLLSMTLGMGDTPSQRPNVPSSISLGVDSSLIRERSHHMHKKIHFSATDIAAKSATTVDSGLLYFLSQSQNIEPVCDFAVYCKSGTDLKPVRKPDIVPRFSSMKTLLHPPSSSDHPPEDEKEEDDENIEEDENPGLSP